MFIIEYIRCFDDSYSKIYRTWLTTAKSSAFATSYCGPSYHGAVGPLVESPNCKIFSFS